MGAGAGASGLRGVGGARNFGCAVPEARSFGTESAIPLPEFCVGSESPGPRVASQARGRFRPCGLLGVTGAQNYGRAVQEARSFGIESLVPLPKFCVGRAQEWPGLNRRAQEWPGPNRRAQEWPAKQGVGSAHAALVW